MAARKFWIRRDREQYLLSGVIITCVIGGFVSSYWHFSDRLNIRKDIKMTRKLSTEAEQKKLREVQYSPQKPGPGGNRYYRLDETTIPNVPKLEEDEGD
ncbi:MAG: hypothetical protein NDI60_03665 [Elusimicrobiales bacterium]|nr:hypothetical protein [Elusimicrobiales bacterium]